VPTGASRRDVMALTVILSARLESVIRLYPSNGCGCIRGGERFHKNMFWARPPSVSALTIEARDPVSPASNSRFENHSYHPFCLCAHIGIGRIGVFPLPFALHLTA
jgi:hypothetical protein